MTTTKKCHKCGKTKPRSGFHRHTKKPDGLQTQCIACRKNPVQQKKDKLNQLYKITLDQYEMLLRAQDGRCGICKRLPEEVSKKALSVDHCHDTKTIRGLLCNKCNFALGLFEERTTLLQAAIEYLERFEHE